MPFPHLDVTGICYTACQSEHPHLQFPGILTSSFQALLSAQTLPPPAAATTTTSSSIYAQLPSSALHQASTLSFCNAQSHPHFTSWEAEAFEKEPMGEVPVIHSPSDHKWRYKDRLPEQHGDLSQTAEDMQASRPSAGNG